MGKAKGKSRGSAGKSKKQSKAKRGAGKRPPPRPSGRPKRARPSKANARMFSDEQEGVDPALAVPHRRFSASVEAWSAAAKEREEAAADMLKALHEAGREAFELDGVKVSIRKGADKLKIERQKGRSIEIDED